MPTAKKPVEQSAAGATAETSVDPWSVMEDVYIPKINGDKSQFVAVNGRSYMVPCGKTVSVPAPIAEVIRHSQEAMAEAEEVAEALLSKQ